MQSRVESESVAARRKVREDLAARWQQALAHFNQAHRNQLALQERVSALAAAMEDRISSLCPADHAVNDVLRIDQPD